MNVGFATLQVIPSLRGVDKSIQSQLGPQMASAGQRAGASAGQGFASRFGSAVSGLASRVGSTITSGLSAAGTAGAVLFGAALTKGFGRVTAIEDATAALTIQLGDAAAAGQLLDGVLSVIKGTPFNLDQFASAGARLVAMGIEAQKVPRYLEAIGEASATQGRRSGEFVERLTRVFGQISAQSRIMGEDVLQLSEAGVNALAILGNHFGKTTSEMRDMIASGAVPAKEALDVLAEGILNGSDGINGATIKLGGTMDALRLTLSGSIGGFGSALSRFGAAFITPLSPLLTQAFGAGSTLLDALTTKVQDAAGTIEARLPAFNRLFDWVADTADNVGPLVDKLGEIAPALAPILGIAAGLGASSLAGALGPLGLLIPSLGPLGGLMAALVVTSPELRDALVGIAEAAAPLVGEIFGALKPVLAQLAPVVTVIATALGDLLLGALERLTPLVPALVEFVAALGDALVTLLPALVEVGLALLDALLPAVEALLPVLTALTPVLAAVAAALAGIIAAAPPGVIQAVVGAFLAFRGVQAGVSAFRSLRESVTSTVSTISNARGAVSRFFSAGGGGGRVADGFRSVGRAASGMVSGIRSGATALAQYGRAALLSAANTARATAAWVAQKVAMIATTVATKAMTIAQGALNLVLALNPIFLVVLAIAALIAALVLAYNKVGWFRDFVDASFRAVQAIVGAVVDWIKNNWQTLLAILTGPIGLAVLFITQHWETIKNGVTAVKDWIVGRFNDVISFVTGLPGALASAAGNVWGWLAENFRGAINRIIGWWNNLRFPAWTAPSINIPGLGKIGGFTIGGWDLPDIGLRLHEGGMFTAPNGDREGVALLEDGEGVFTRDQVKALGGAVRGGGGAELRITGKGPLAEFFHKAVRTGEVQLYDGEGKPVKVAQRG